MFNCLDLPLVWMYSIPIVHQTEEAVALFLDLTFVSIKDMSMLPGNANQLVQSLVMLLVCNAEDLDERREEICHENVCVMFSMVGIR